MARRFLGSALFISLFVSTAAHAQWQFSGAAGMREVRTTETDRNVRRLVEEKGWLPGLELRADYLFSDWRFGVSGETYRHDISYEGRLQNGAGFSTDTETALSRISIDAARQITGATRLIAGIEWDHWQRNIEGRGNTLGLNERYTSWRLLGGGETRLLQSAWATINAKALLVMAAPEKMKVRFQNEVFDDAHLSTKSATGLRLAFGIQPAAVPAMTVTADFDWLRIARSDDAVLRRSGVPVGTVAQPEHTRQAFGIRLAYRF
jgi:hypothetical protein